VIRGLCKSLLDHETPQQQQPQQNGTIPGAYPTKSYYKHLYLQIFVIRNIFVTLNQYILVG
jgi:hypothetical protein